MSNKKEYVRFKYTEQDLELAVKAVRNGELSQNAASKEYGIPKATLNTKVRELVPMERKMGPKTVLSAAEETMLSNWIIGKAKLGFPMHPNDVQTAVQKVLLATNRDNPFTNTKPGKKWLSLFLNRRPEISQRNTEIISKARAAVTEEGIREWFRDLERYILEENLQDIFLNPDRIYNADELGMQFCPKTGKLLGPKKYKDFYMISSGPEKESMTVLCNFAASGLRVPPMLVVPYKRIPRDVAASIPDSYFIGRSDSGWMTSETFYEYVANCFFPWLQENNIQFPVFLFLDGHKSHINVELFEFCREKQIVLYCLLPNATHILQPCDVSIFKPLKTAWKKIMLEYKQETNKYLTKVNFAPLFQKAFENGINTDVIKNGFRACGIYPLDADAIDYSKCISFRRKELFSQTENKESIHPTSNDFKSVLKVLKFYYNERIIKNEAHADDIRDLYTFCQNKLLSSSDTNCHNITLTESAIDLMPIQFDDISFCLNDASINNVSFLPGSNSNEIISIPNETDDEKNDIEVTKMNLGSHCEPEVTVVVVESNINEKQDNTLDIVQEDNCNKENQTENTINNNLECVITGIDKSEDRFMTPDPDFKENDEEIMIESQTKKCKNDFDDVKNEKNEKKKIVVLSDIKILSAKKINNNLLWKEHLHWPKIEETKNQKKKEKMPFAITSKQWKEYYDKKENTKRLKSESVKLKKLERMKKVEELLKKKTSKRGKNNYEKNHSGPKIKRRRLSGNKKEVKLQDQEARRQRDGETRKNLKNDNNFVADEFCARDFVIVLYDGDGKHYPGKIENVTGDEYEISTMEFSKTLNLWQWPKRPDKIWYRKNNILEKISEPKAEECLGFYKVEEMSKYFLL